MLHLPSQPFAVAQPLVSGPVVASVLAALVLASATSAGCREPVAPPRNVVAAVSISPVAPPRPNSSATADEDEIDEEPPPSPAASATADETGDSPEPSAPSGIAGPAPPPASAGFPFPFPAPAPASSSSSPAGTAKALPTAALAAVEPLLHALAAKEAAGMQPVGAAFGGVFRRGETLQQTITMGPGRCYMVIAVGTGITELDVRLAIDAPGLPPGLGSAVLAQDATSGPVAILGGRGQCFKNPLPLPIPVAVAVEASAGAGIAAARVYSK